MDGVYAQIESVKSGLGIELRDTLQDFDFSLDSKIPDAGFHRYDRLALAELVIERVEGRLVIRPYIEFSKQYEKLSHEKEELLLPAKSFVLFLKDQKSKSDELMKNLMAIDTQVAKETKIEPRIQERAVKVLPTSSSSPAASTNANSTSTPAPPTSGSVNGS